MVGNPDHGGADSGEIVFFSLSRKASVSEDPESRYGLPGIGLVRS
jgi:hypothetical protein